MLSLVLPIPQGQYIFKILFIYFWLCWVFLAAQGLSLIAVSRGYSLVEVLGHLIGVEAQSLNHWTTREVPISVFFEQIS